MFNDKFSHEQTFKMFVESVQYIIEKVENKHKELKKDPDRERTRAFYTQKILKEWFNNNGNIPI